MLKCPLTISDDGDVFTLREVDISKKPTELVYASVDGELLRGRPNLIAGRFTFDRPAPKGEFIQQGKYECAAAALAMLLGHSMFMVKSVMGEVGWRNDDRGASEWVSQQAARAFGRDLVSVDWKTIHTLGNDLPAALVGVRSLNVPNMGHGLTWLNGEILDPNFGHPTRKYWGANWSPWTMGSAHSQVLAKQPLSLQVHRELKKIREKAPDDEVREAILAIAA